MSQRRGGGGLVGDLDQSRSYEVAWRVKRGRATPGGGSRIAVRYDRVMATVPPARSTRRRRDSVSARSKLSARSLPISLG